jgi:hypothetical protein
VRPHLFSYSDVYRIVRVVEPSRDWRKVDLGWVFLTILASEKDLLTSLRLKGINLFPEQDSVEFILKQVEWLGKILVGAPIEFILKVLADLAAQVGIVARPAPAPTPPPPPPRSPPPVLPEPNVPEEP